MSLPMATAVYARISDDTEGQAAGVTRQVEDANALVQRLGWTLAPIPPFVDNDISASTRSSAKRPAFDRLVQAVRSGSVNAIAYYSLSALRTRQEAAESALGDLLAPDLTMSAAEPQRTWESGTLEERRRVLAVLVDHIKIMPMGGGIGARAVRERIPDTTVIVWRT